MVLPPFSADDSNTAPLRWVLDGHGYAVYGWKQGPNLSRTRRIVDGLPRWLIELHERHGAKVSLVGHSGGGNWARDLARQYPAAVRQVITLGSPFRLRPGDGTRADRIAKLLLRDQVPPDAEALIDEEPARPTSGPRDRHLHPHRRRRPMAGGHRIGRAAAGEHRGTRQPLRPRLPPRSRHRRHRSPRPTRRTLAAVPPAALHPPPVPHPRLLAPTFGSTRRLTTTRRHVLDTTCRDLATGAAIPRTRRVSPPRDRPTPSSTGGGTQRVGDQRRSWSFPLARRPKRWWRSTMPRRPPHVAAWSLGGARGDVGKSSQPQRGGTAG